ncbi:MAG TPA: hypothetical protein VFG28_05015, partial [Syntrophales bacterium]|nr:hypothetical protein [Syntrophales bacterium]
MSVWISLRVRSTPERPKAGKTREISQFGIRMIFASPEDDKVRRRQPRRQAQVLSKQQKDKEGGEGKEGEKGRQEAVRSDDRQTTKRDRIT